MSGDKSTAVGIISFWLTAITIVLLFTAIIPGCLTNSAAEDARYRTVLHSPEYMKVNKYNIAGSDEYIYVLTIDYKFDTQEEAYAFQHYIQR